MARIAAVSPARAGQRVVEGRIACGGCDCPCARVELKAASVAARAERPLFGHGVVAELASAAQQVEVEATVYDETAADSGRTHHGDHVVFATAGAEFGLG